MFEAWGENEPNNAGGSENCVVFRVKLNKNGVWYDKSCASNQLFICENTILSKYFLIELFSSKSDIPNISPALVGYYADIM